MLALLPCVVALLSSESNVVHSYAALCVERMLTVREGGALRYVAADLAPMRDQARAPASTRTCTNCNVESVVLSWISAHSAIFRLLLEWSPLPTP